MTLELVETPNEEYWKVRVYWRLKQFDDFAGYSIEYSNYLANHILLKSEILDWCREQEGDSMMIPAMLSIFGVAFTNIADATAFALVWSARISETV
jgi:hypothetical protein